MDQKDNNDVKFNKIIKIVEVCTALIVAITALVGVINIPQTQTIQIVKCAKTEELHLGEAFSVYSIEIEPAMSVATVCVQGYIQVAYDDVQQVVLLDHLYTQDAYKSAENQFMLYKHPVEQDVSELLCESLLDQMKEAGLRTSDLEVNYDTVLCFVYNDEKNQAGEYFLLNAAQPLKISDDKARRILNTQYDTIKLDVEKYDEKAISETTEKLLINMK